MPHRPAALATRAERARRLAGARLYVCTDLSRHVRDDGALDAGAFAAFAAACFRGGVDALQVRDKQVEVGVELEALAIVVELAREHGALSAANDRADVALLAGADVFHAGQDDLTSTQARRVLGPEVLLGRSCRTEEQVRGAAADPELDYFCTGPVWETPTKPGRAAVGLALPRFAAEITAPGGEAAGRVFFAIGGIDEDRVPAVLGTGAERIVVVRAVTGADDPEAAARSLRAAVTG